MPIEPSITRATNADAGEILTVQRAAYVSEAQLYDDPFLPPLVETLTEVRAVLAGGAVVLVARTGNRLVGSVRVRMDGLTGHVGRLAVVPDLQGQGIGSRLLGRAEATCPATVTRLEIFTGASSEGNLRLYRRHGYVPYAHHPAGAGPGLTYLEKRISRPARSAV